MSYRIEEKLFLKSENLLQFKEFLTKKSAKTLFNKRTIEITKIWLNDFLINFSSFNI